MQLSLGKNPSLNLHLNSGSSLNLSSGLSLIQLMISLALCMIVTTASLYGYQLYKTTYLKFHQKINDHILSSTIWQFLQMDLLNTGYKGCRTLDKNYPTNRVYIEPNKNLKIFPEDGRIVFGFNTLKGACLGRLPDRICQKVTENSDVLVLYQVAKGGGKLKMHMDSPSAPLVLDDNSSLHKNSVVLINDCLRGDVFIANRVEGNILHHDIGLYTNFQKNLSKSYLIDSEVVELETVTYFIGNSKSNKFVLYRDSLMHGSEAIAEDIVDFKVYFGIADPQNTSILFLRPELIKGWNEIQILKIQIKTTTGEQEYYFKLRNGHRISHSFNTDYSHDGTIYALAA